MDFYEDALETNSSNNKIDALNKALEVNKEHRKHNIQTITDYRSDQFIYRFFVIECTA